MEIHKISLMEAYQIETLRSNGVTNEEILRQAETENIAAWTVLQPKFDFQVLLELATKDLEQFKQLLTEGYQVKFVTFNGLKNLLRLRLGKQEGKDFTTEETGIKQLVLDQEEAQLVKQMLSPNWVIKETANQDTVLVDIHLA